MKLSKRDTAGTLTDLITGMTMCVNILCKLDVHVDYGTSITIYKDGVQIGQDTTDSRTNGATTLARVDYAGGMGSASGPANWSEMFVADEDTRNLRLWTCVPQAAGTDQNWPSALVGNINEAVADDTTYNSTRTASQRSNWTLCSNLSSDYTVKDVTTCNRATRHDATMGGPQNYRSTAYIGGTNYDQPTDVDPGRTGFVDTCYDWGATSPASGSAWTKGAIRTMQTGITSKP